MRKENKERNKRAYTSGVWNPNPFEGIEKRLPVNVVYLRRMSEEVSQKIANPEQAYVGRTSKVVMRYRKACSDSPLCVVSLGHDAKKLAGLRVKALAFDEYEMKVSGWPEALAILMSYAAHDRTDDVEVMAVGGLLTWASKTSQSLDAVEAWKKGLVSIEFPSVAHICARIQWLFLMLGISLADVGVCYEELDAKRYTEYRKRYFPEAVAAVGKGEDRQNDDAARKTATGVVRPKDQGRKLRVLEKTLVTNSLAKNQGHYYQTDNYGISSYISVNGVVVMQGHDGFGGDGRISRSSSESEDTWKGVGFIARDEGRYGSLDGELYSD